MFDHALAEFEDIRAKSPVVPGPEPVCSFRSCVRSGAIGRMKVEAGDIVKKWTKSGQTRAMFGLHSGEFGPSSRAISPEFGQTSASSTDPGPVPAKHRPTSAEFARASLRNAS